MFLPVIILTQEPSALARELGEQIALFVMEYRQDNPELSSMEVQQAFMLARQDTNKELGENANMKPFIALMLGVAFMGFIGVLFLFFGGAGGGGGSSTPVQPTVLIFALSVVVVLFGVFLAIRIKRNQR